MTAQAILVIRRMISAGALKSTREGACAPLGVLDQESQPVAFLVVGTQGTEQARAHRVHLGLLHPVIQLQIREAAAGGLNDRTLESNTAYDAAVLDNSESEGAAQEVISERFSKSDRRKEIRKFEKINVSRATRIFAGFFTGLAIATG